MATTQPVATAPRALGRTVGRVVRWSVILLLLAALAGVVALVAFGRSYDGRVLPGVVVGGVAVGGMTEAQARTAIDDALGALDDGQIQLVSSRTTGVISYAEVGRAIDGQGMLEEALAQGRTGTRFEEALAGLQGLLRPTTVPIRIGYDRPTLAAKLAAFRLAGERQPIDAQAGIVHGSFTTTPAHDGVAVDTSGVEPQIDAALLDPATPPVIRYETESTVLPPATSDDDVARAVGQARRIAAPIKLATANRSWSITAKVLTGWMTFEGTGASYGPAIDTGRATAILKSIKKHVAIKPTNATFVRDRGGRVFGVSASAAGRELDVEATVDSIVNILDGRAVVDVTYFNSRLQNEVVTIFLPSFRSSVRNLDGVSTRQGVEVAGKVSPTDWLTLGATYTYTDARDDKGVQEIRRPRHAASGTATALFDGGRGKAVVNVVYNGKMPDTVFKFPTETVTLDAYTLVAGQISYDTTPWSTVYIRAENIFDRRYEQVFSYRSPGAAVYAGLKIRSN